MNWVHCNTCYMQPSADNPPLVITSCGHIYCVKCIEKVPREKCAVCQTSFTTTDLRPEMKPEIKEYFQDPVEIANKAISVANFQAGHRNRLYQRMRSYQSKYASLRNDAVKYAEENAGLRKKVKNLEMYVAWHKNQLAALKLKLKESRCANLQMDGTSNDDRFSDFTPGPSMPGNTRSQYHYGMDNRFSSVNSPNQYRSNPTFTPFATPSTTVDSATGFSYRSNTPYSSAASTGGYKDSTRNSNIIVRTPQEFSSPSVLRPLHFDDRHTPLFRRNI